MKNYEETRFGTRAYQEVSYKRLDRDSPAVPRVISVGVDGLRKHTQRVRDTLVTLSFCVYNTRQLILLYSIYSSPTHQLMHNSVSRRPFASSSLSPLQPSASTDCHDFLNECTFLLCQAMGVPGFPHFLSLTPQTNKNSTVYFGGSFFTKPFFGLT